MALQLYYKENLSEVNIKVKTLFDTLLQLAETHKNKLLPGYTHLQVAMPSSFGLWFSAYAELLIDDVYILNAVKKIVDQNPLGSAAGYGSSFPIDREFTTKELDFSTLKYNVVAAQLSRGKSERAVANALGGLCNTLGRFAMDICLYMSQNFGFVSFPDELTTGSSIMPHKKNPDVFELIRGKCNKIQALHTEMLLITNNLPSGYHRDFQLVKNPLVYEHSSIDHKNRGITPNTDYFTLFEFSAKWDPVPTMLTQNHTTTIKGFMGQSTAFKKEYVKPNVLIMGENKGINEANITYASYSWQGWH